MAAADVTLLPYGPPPRSGVGGPASLGGPDTPDEETLIDAIARVTVAFSPWDYDSPAASNVGNRTPMPTLNLISRQMYRQLVEQGFPDPGTAQEFTDFWRLISIIPIQPIDDFQKWEWGPPGPAFPPPVQAQGVPTGAIGTGASSHKKNLYFHGMQEGTWQRFPYGYKPSTYNDIRIPLQPEWVENLPLSHGGGWLASYEKGGSPWWWDGSDSAKYATQLEIHECENEPGDISAYMNHIAEAPGGTPIGPDLAASVCRKNAELGNPGTQTGGQNGFLVYNRPTEPFLAWPPLKWPLGGGDSVPPDDVAWDVLIARIRRLLPNFPAVYAWFRANWRPNMLNPHPGWKPIPHLYVFGGSSDIRARRIGLKVRIIATLNLPLTWDRVTNAFFFHESELPPPTPGTVIIGTTGVPGEELGFRIDRWPYQGPTEFPGWWYASLVRPYPASLETSTGGTVTLDTFWPAGPDEGYIAFGGADRGGRRHPRPIASR